MKHRFMLLLVGILLTFCAHAQTKPLDPNHDKRLQYNFQNTSVRVIAVYESMFRWATLQSGSQSELKLPDFHSLPP